MKKVFVLTMIFLILPVVQAIEVSEPEPITIQTGSTGFVHVTVSETNEEAVWSIHATCSEGFSQEGGAFTGKGSQTISLPILCGGEKETGTCEITVQDMNKPSNMDSKTIDVECITLKICNPGERRCDGNEIEFCTEDGSGWETYTICENGCEFKNFEPKCKTNVTEFDPTLILFGVIIVIVLIILYWKRDYFMR